MCKFKRPTWWYIVSWYDTASLTTICCPTRCGSFCGCKRSASVSNVSESLIKLELNRIELIVDCSVDWKPESLIGSHWLGGCKNAVHHELSSHPGLCIAFKGSRLKPMQVEARHHATVLRKFGSAFEQQGAGARPLDSPKVARRCHGVVMQMYVM